MKLRKEKSGFELAGSWWPWAQVWRDFIKERPSWILIIIRPISQRWRGKMTGMNWEELQIHLNKRKMVTFSSMLLGTSLEIREERQLVSAWALSKKWRKMEMLQTGSEGFLVWKNRASLTKTHPYKSVQETRDGWIPCSWERVSELRFSWISCKDTLRDFKKEILGADPEWKTGVRLDG